MAKPHTKQIELLVSMYTERIQKLEEELEYERLKNDAYRMVWSAREYLKSLPQTKGTDAAIHYVLSGALNTLERERVDGKAIRDKYQIAANPVFVIKKTPKYGIDFSEGDPVGTIPGWTENVPTKVEAKVPEYWLTGAKTCRTNRTLSNVPKSDTSDGDDWKQHWGPKC